MKCLQADLNVESLDEIDAGYWYARGIRCILIDLDNTVSPWRKNRVTGEAKDLKERAGQAGITVVLFSNAHEERARETAWEMGVAYYASTKKPFPGMYKKAMGELDFSPAEIMTVGDQVFTDVLGGNLAGCTTVLAAPLSEIEFSGTRMLRLLERFIAGRKIVYRDEGTGRDEKPAAR